MPVEVTLDGSVARVCFGTGERGNAMTPEVRAGLRSALSEISETRAIRALVLRGHGEHFCAGADLRAHHSALTEDPGSVTGSTRREFSPIIETLASLPIPVVAFLKGIVAGAGLGLALVSDIRIASPTTRFSTAFASIGLGPDSGVSYFLPRLIGHSRAIDLLLRPRPVAAQEALEIGLVHEVTESTAERVDEVAQEFARGPSFAYQAIKATLGADIRSLSAALETEATWQEQAARTHDHRHAVEAFITKETPSYRGH